MLSSDPSPLVPTQAQILAQTDQFEVLSCQWTENQNSNSQSRQWNECRILIQEGTFESILDLGANHCETRLLQAGDSFEAPMGSHYQLRCTSPRGQTFHVNTLRLNPTAFAPLFAPPRDLRPPLGLSSESLSWAELQKTVAQLQGSMVTTDHGLFMNQLYSGLWPEARLANQIAAENKTTLATQEAGGVLADIETEVVRALGAKIGWPANQVDGLAVPGGSAANMMALHLARHQRFPNWRKQGATGEQVRVYVSSDAHYSFQKACVALGIGTDSLVAIATDDQGRMSVDNLKTQVQLDLQKGCVPLMIVATAGTTVWGSFDPVEALASVCQQLKVWLHVDGAWGGPALFHAELRSQFLQGLELADSMTFDAHKLLGAAMTSSFVLTRHPNVLLAANDVSGGSYLFHENGKDRGRSAWQCGRGPDALAFWLTWKSRGSDGLADFLTSLLDVRDELLQWIAGQPRLELVRAPAYLNVCVRVLDPSGKRDRLWSRHVREQLRDHNQAFVNFSEDANGSFLRLILVNPHLELSHLQQILRAALLIHH